MRAAVPPFLATRGRAWRLGLLGGALLLAGAFAQAGTGAVEEQELKAAIVFNLLLFVEWPPEALPPQAPSLAVCVARTHAMQPALKALEGRPVRSQHLDVRDLPDSGATTGCHAVVLDDAPASRAVRPAAGTLLLADGDAPASGTAAIVLHRAGNRLVFDVNLPAARRARLQLSAKLLRLARTVTE